MSARFCCFNHVHTTTTATSSSFKRFFSFFFLLLLHWRWKYFDYLRCLLFFDREREQKRRKDDWEWYSTKTMMMMMWLFSLHIRQRHRRKTRLEFWRDFINTTYPFLFKVLGKHTLLIIIIIIITLFSSSSLIFTHVRINWNSLRFPCAYFEQHQITYKVHTRIYIYVYIYIHIRVDWNLYFSLSLYRSFLYSHTRAYIDRFVLKKKSEEEEEEDDDDNRSMNFIVVINYISFEYLNQRINSWIPLKYQAKFVSSSNVSFYIFTIVVLLLLKTSLVRVYSRIDLRTSVSYIFLNLFHWFLLFIDIDMFKIIIIERDTYRYIPIHFLFVWWLS